MHNSVLRWGMPGGVDTVARDRLLIAITKHHPGLTILVGPSGSGKSVAAMQYARSQPAALWLSLRGQALDAGILLREIARTLQSEQRESADADTGGSYTDVLQRVKADIAASGTSRLLVVADSCASPADGSAVIAARKAQEDLRPFDIPFVLTMRGLSERDMLAARDALVVDRQRLAFNAEETRLLASSLDVTASEETLGSCSESPRDTRHCSR